MVLRSYELNLCFVAKMRSFNCNRFIEHNASSYLAYLCYQTAFVRLSVILLPGFTTVARYVFGAPAGKLPAHRITTDRPLMSDSVLIDD